MIEALIGLWVLLIFVLVLLYIDHRKKKKRHAH